MSGWSPVKPIPIISGEKQGYIIISVLSDSFHTAVLKNSEDLEASVKIRFCPLGDIALKATDITSTSQDQGPGAAVG